MIIKIEDIITENYDLKCKLDVARKALIFYSEGGHFDLVRVESDPKDTKRTRILDTGAEASAALKIIFPGYALKKGCIDDGPSNILDAIKLVYRKHHLGDETIGWDELSSILHNAICNEIGDDAFNAWIKTLKNNSMNSGHLS